MKLIKAATNTSYTLALDTGKKKTARYSAGNREFTGYVIDPKGVIKSIFKGDVRNRATSEQLLNALAEVSKMSEGSGSKGSATKGSDTKGSATKGSATKGSSTSGSATKGSTVQGSAAKGSSAKGSSKK